MKKRTQRPQGVKCRVIMFIDVISGYKFSRLFMSQQIFDGFGLPEVVKYRVISIVSSIILAINILPASGNQFEISN